MIVPDGIEPVEVMRAWRVDVWHGWGVPTGLCSLNYVEWTPGTPMVAQCVAEIFRGEHEAPDERCSCGIYGATNMLQLPVGHSFIYGKAKVWGKIVPGEKGVRGQYAYPSEFHLPRRSSGRRSVYLPILERYGVAVVEHDTAATWPFNKVSWMFATENYWTLGDRR